jgi:hypothetical protein
MPNDTCFATVSGRTIIFPRLKGTLKQRLRQTDRWLHTEALRETAPAGDAFRVALNGGDYQHTLVRALNPEALSESDRAALNQLLFGRPEGVTADDAL